MNCTGYKGDRPSGGGQPVATYVAVHGGAGVHRHGTEKEVRQALREACSKAMHLGSPSSALRMTEDAIIVLEDNPYLNAGLGSNLTLDGTVECDASIMSAVCAQFGSVGAVSGIKNPISLARSILEYSSTKDRLGRIPPLTLVASGATSFARSRAGIQPVDPSSMITPDSKKAWEKWISRLEAPDPPGTVPMTVPPMPPTQPSDAVNAHPESDSIHDSIQDTVGAVAWHPADGAAAGVSSGGMLLKFPGRVGEAGVYGAGCWAEQDNEGPGGNIAVACSVSGTGEDIVRAQLARSIGEQVLCAMRTRRHSDLNAPEAAEVSKEDMVMEDESAEDDPLETHNILQQTLEGQFWERFKKEGEQSPSAGVVLLTKEVDEDEQNSVRLWCAFTTPSMAIGYASPRHPKAKAVILRHPDGSSTRDGQRPRIFITAVPL